MRRLALGLIVALSASAITAARAADLPPLTGADHIAIAQMYGRTLHDDGRATHTRSWLTNLAVEPAPSDGAAPAPSKGSTPAAVGWAYILHSHGMEMGPAELYKDRLVKSGGVWKVASRERFPGTAAPPREPYTAPANDHATTFTARDYAEIRGIVSRYNLGYDNYRATDQGALRDLSFAPGAKFEPPVAPPAAPSSPPAAPSVPGVGGSVGLHHWDSGVLLDVSPTGEVTTYNYDMQFIVSEGGSPVNMRSGGVLTHTYTRTPNGWLISFRHFDTLRSPPIPWPKPGYGLVAANVAPEPGERGRLQTPDYLEIEQLYAKNNIAFDSAADGGMAFANTFTADGSLVRKGGTTKGQAALAALAAANAPTLHTWTSNLVVEPTSSGAKGRIYVLNFTSDAKQSVNDVGTFEDVLVKTRDGWRFKTRTYTSEAP